MPDEKYRGSTIPEGAIQKEFLKSAIDQHRDEKEKKYGHAPANLASAIMACASVYNDLETQQKNLRDSAIELIEEWGPEFLTHLREDLKLALTEEDLAEINKALEEKKNSK